MSENRLALEKSTNTHTLESNSRIDSTNITESIVKVKLNGDTVITHGEHGTLKIESDNVIKYVQQEVNPVTKKMQNAFD